MHEPVVNSERSDAGVERYNARLGMGLFVVYLLLYGAFVVINAVWPSWMDRAAGMGLNMAVVYGLGLIALAFVIALVYALLSKNPAKEQA